ncbi:MAG TPA: FmdB family zinc ribbon protein [Acidimicrobiales bacterium]
MALARVECQLTSAEARLPTYEYRCRDCGEHLEVVQSFRDDPLTECPNCGGSLRKVFSAIGISFKGSGFYKTDSRASGGSGGSGGGGKGESGSSSSSSSSSSSGESSSGSGSGSSSGSGSGSSSGSGSGSGSGSSGSGSTSPSAKSA